MSAPRFLNVFLRGRHIGELHGKDLKLSFQYDSATVAEYGAGSILLSLSMPVRRKRYEGPEVYNYFDGLLPEGQVRAHLASQNNVSTPDAYGVLTALGADCAGAVQVLPPEVEPEAPLAAAPMTEDQVTAAVESLPTWELPEGFLVTASLGGVQSKVLLTRLADGWAWPGRGAASTHIIKPAPTDAAIPLLLPSEHWALSLAAAAGLPAASTSMETFGSRQAIVVERFDRGDDGSRLHQEDFTQALSLPSSSKYEGGLAARSRLGQIAGLAAPFTRSADAFHCDLLRAITFNLLIGNGDAHSKNYSLSLGDNGEVRLAPLYDVAPTLLLYAQSVNAGHTVNRQIRLPYITLEHLVAEAVSWGLGEDAARNTTEAVLHDAAEAAADVPAPVDLEFLQDLIPKRASQLLAGGTAGRTL